jgi:GNAT superfamily N-acetyltransferase
MPNVLRRTQDLPPGYPRGYDCVVGLADGRRVEIRPILPSDAPELAEAIRTADAETLHARFMGGPPRLTPAVMDGLTRLDYINRFALVARSRGRCLGASRGVAIARYAAQPSEQGSEVVAEIALAVALEWRRVGLATVLVELLARRAQECGITDFTAQFLAQNRPVAELAQDGHARVVVAKGIAQLHATLNTPHDDWPGYGRSAKRSH